MKRFAIHLTSIFVLALSIGFFGVLALTALPSLVVAQDAPAAECGFGPNVVCPVGGDPAAQYIGSVTAVPDGIVLLLTDDGLTKARECGGATEIAQMAAALYATIPDAEKADFQFDWGSQQLADEIYGHAFLNELSSGVPGMSDIFERSNPINIVFADYDGPGRMTAQAIAEQTTYAALGGVHRAAC